MIDAEHIIQRLSQPGRKVILIHGNADMDALGSAYGIKRVFPDADIFAPAKLDRVAKMVAEKLDIAVLEEADFSKYSLAVQVDTSSPDLFQNESLVLPEDMLVIDHHAETGRWAGKDYQADSTRSSCCEIVYDIIAASGRELPRDAGLALLGGILTDGGHFQFVDSRSFRTFADIMDRCSIPIDEALALVRAPVNMNEKFAAMKSIGRSRFERVGDMIVAISFSSSYEAACCRALLLSGADVAFVGSQKEDDTFRVSGRATQEIVRRGLNLCDVMGELAVETETEGGGHGGAAGMTGTGDVEAMCHMCLQKTMAVFRKIKTEMDSQVT